jgi:hypothetical protein
MNIKNFWRGPTSMKLLIIMVILIWLIPFALLIAGLTLFLERPGAALEATPPGAMPTLILEPSSGPVGTMVRVQGEGWPAGNLVSIHLMAPTETAIPTYAVTSAVADQGGRFLTEFVFPAESRWVGQTIALVVAQSSAGEMTAGANFALLGQVGPPAATVEPTREAADLIPPPVSPVIPTVTDEPTPTIEPTATATLVVQPPTATPQPAQALITAITDLKIRSGPGINNANSRLQVERHVDGG